MENSEIVGVSYTGSGLNESDRSEAENTVVVIETDKDKRTGADGCVVMAIDNNDDKQPQQTGTLALDGVPNAVATAPTTTTEYDEETKSDTENIRTAVDAPGPIIEADGSTAAKRNETVELAASTVNVDKDAMETDTGGVVAAIPQILSGKPTSKSNEVTAAKPVGSLGLLVQYVSSSEDEDSEDSAALDAKAKDLFDRAMSKGDYRVADDEDDSDELVIHSDLMVFL